MNQKLVEPYPQKEIDTLTPEDIKRGCLKYRMEINKEYITLEIDGEQTQFRFMLKSKPILPMKLFKEVWSKGWDIPTLIAIDSNNRCFVSDAHGGALEEFSYEVLMNEIEDEETRNEVRIIFGEKIKVRCSCCKGTGWVEEK
jgi:hypothetical protein